MNCAECGLDAVTADQCGNPHDGCPRFGIARAKCPKCGDSGWRPNRDSNGDRVWTPLMNDGFPCECGALRRNYAAEKLLNLKNSRKVYVEGTGVGEVSWRGDIGKYVIHNANGTDSVLDI
jgi:hypothetical protein